MSNFDKIVHTLEALHETIDENHNKFDAIHDRIYKRAFQIHTPMELWKVRKIIRKNVVLLELANNLTDKLRDYNNEMYPEDPIP